MKNLLKSNKGISLVTLCITVAVLLILTNVIIYNTADNLRTTKLKNMQSDIENLRDKISNYYSQYGTIPANKDIEYTNIEDIKNSGVISTAVDEGKFYVIDLASMENITLNYGRDYEKIKNGEATTEEQINSLKDLYIINETSHNIFYVQGIKVDDETFYTDYSAEDADKVAVNLHFTEEQKERSINQIESGKVSDKNESYEDENGNKAIIPAGFKILPGEEIINEGLVIQDENGNQFVWIPVQNTEKYIRNRNYEDEKISSVVYTDTTYLPEELQPLSEDSSTKNEEKEKQLVLNAGGFYISRYEAGIENNSLVSKKDKEVWTNISQTSAKETAKQFINNENVKSSLCSGIQWDVVMNFINEKQDGERNTFSATNYLEGRHNDKISISGQNEKDKVCNIYDLEGNCNEYVAERTNSSTSSYIVRGGSIGQYLSAAERQEDYGGGNPETSFRFVLYIVNDR